MKLTVGRYEWSPELPQVGRTRAIVICGMAAAAMTLWFLALLEGLAGMRPTWPSVVGGIVIPWGWAWPMLLWAEYRIKRELKPAARRPLPEHDEAEPVQAGAR